MFFVCSCSSCIAVFLSFLTLWSLNAISLFLFGLFLCLVCVCAFGFVCLCGFGFVWSGAVLFVLPAFSNVQYQLSNQKVLAHREVIVVGTFITISRDSFPLPCVWIGCCVTGNDTDAGLF